MTIQEQHDMEERQRGRKRKTDGNYASKYYDPDKAHEYYMKHRKLKGTSGSSSTSTKSSTKKKKSSTKKSSTKKYSDTEKQILADAKQNTEENIANLKDIVADWVDKQNEELDKLSTTGLSKEEKAKVQKQKEAIRNRIKAMKREMNKQIRQARAIYRKYKAAYTQHNIEKFAAEQAASAKKGDDNGNK